MESLYRLVKEMVVTQLRDRVGPDLTVDVIRERVERTSDFMTPLSGEGLAPETVDELVRDLETVFNVWIGTPQILENGTGHVPWLPERRDDIQWRFWSRYRTYIQGQWASPSTVGSLEALTDEVLSRLENPDRPGPWDRRGLVVGHVQSGKTANYTGLICKAVDAGYGLVIVLAGMHSNLRTQTQIRLEEGFLGYVSYGSEDVKPAVGVGLIDSSLTAGSVTHRGDKGDFSKSFAKQFNIAPGQQPLLFVVKKNAHILRNLGEWVRGFANATEAETGRRYVRGVPVLVIDDEADQASVNSAALGEDPKRMNSLIRQLLHSFEQSAYVGYTATPFANIFIHDEAATDKEGADLFPSSFVISLPVPSNYIGPARVFGLDGDPDLGIDPSDALPLVRVADDAREWLPERHKKDFRPTPRGELVLPPSLREAILSFILSGAAKAARGLGSEHHSMLIHVTRFVKVQESVARQVAEELASIKHRVVYGDGGGESIEQELRSLWEADFCPTTTEVSRALLEVDPFLLPLKWDDIRGYIAQTTESIVVHLVNGLSADSLQYEDHKGTGLKVIAVGGAKLSRGLTLEGLTTSYFLRSSRMYDTLMQMGRWFGYRPRYADLCRLYIPDDIREWFEHITEAGEELRGEFEHMTLIGGTPKDYGLRVKSHPSLLVTSQVRMRSATRLRLSFAGQVSETVVFYRERDAIRGNLNATVDLLRELGDGATRKGGAFIWGDVPPSAVIRFLRAYRTHPLAWRANSNLLADFIEKQRQRQELTTWTVCLATSTASGARGCAIDGRQFGMIRREDAKSGPYANRLVIRRILSPADETADFTAEELDEARALTLAEAEGSGLKLKDPSRASGHSIRTVRPPQRGLLIIYPLDPAQVGRDATLEDKDTPVVGFAVSFPESTTAEAVDYMVGHVYYKQYYGDYGDDWSDEDEDA